MSDEYSPHAFNDFGENADEPCVWCGVKRKEKKGGCPGSPRCNYPKPKGWYCTREKDHEGPCAAVPDCSDPEQCVLQEHRHGLNIKVVSPGNGEIRKLTYKWSLEDLVAALEDGGYDARSANLIEGGPLKVESLEATMKCVTYNAPDSHYQLERYSRWCAKMAKVARFFRLRDLSDLFLRAEGHFLADAQYVREHFFSRAEDRRRPNKA